MSLPHAPFRKGQNLQAYLMSDRIFNLEFNNGTMIRVSALNTVVLCFITIHGIFSLPDISFTQATLRNKIFLWLAGRSPYDRRKSLLSKARFYFGKFIAFCFFLCAVMVAIMSPLVFVSSVILNEIDTWGYPISEQNDAVGQVSRSQNYLRTQD